MKIGTITPTRGNRPVLLNRSREYMKRQTHRPDVSIIVDYPRIRFPFDLTERYRFGLKKLKSQCDLIFFVEDDDYYPPDYIETMLNAYRRAGSPKIFGIGETYFYHPELRHVWYRKHPNDGPCAFQMCIRTDILDLIDWSMVSDLFIDAGLWSQLDGKTVEFGRPLSVGIKHGRGECGAGGHNAWFYRDRQEVIHREQLTDENVLSDPTGKWLRDAIGEDDAQWYVDFASQNGVR